MTEGIDEKPKQDAEPNKESVPGQGTPNGDAPNAEAIAQEARRKANIVEVDLNEVPEQGAVIRLFKDETVCVLMFPVENPVITYGSLKWAEKRLESHFMAKQMKREQMKNRILQPNQQNGNKFINGLRGFLKRG